MNDFSKNVWLYALAGGVAAGMVAGVLLAPEEGKRLRKRISYQMGKSLQEFDAFLGEQYRRFAQSDEESDDGVKRHPFFSEEDAKRMNSLMQDADQLLRNIKAKAN
jgi:gas vesicle protein